MKLTVTKVLSVCGQKVEYRAELEFTDISEQGFPSREEASIQTKCAITERAEALFASLPK